MANRYWVGGSADWDATAGSKWALTSGGTGGQAVPTASDDVFFDGSSGAVTVTLAADSLCKNITFTGFTGTFAGASQLTISGSMVLGAGMTWTHTGLKIFNSASSVTITSNGKHLDGNVRFESTSIGTFTLQDDFYITGSSGIFLMLKGTFNANNHNVTANLYNLAADVINMGSGTWEVLNNGTQAVWSDATTGTLTINASTSTLKLYAAQAGQSPQFSGNGQTYHTILITGTNTGEWSFSGNIICADFQLDNAPNTIGFITGSTLTCTTFTVNGTSSGLVTLKDSSLAAAGTWTLSIASGTITKDYLSLKNSIATGGATFYAGIHSVNVSGNTGWNFIPVPMTNPNNAFADDASYATTADTDGATIGVELSWDAGVTWTAPLYKTLTGSDTVYTFGNGSTELWGRTFVGSEVSDTNFRVRLYCGGRGGKTFKTFGFSPSAGVILTGIEVAVKGKYSAPTASINHVKVKIYYGSTTVVVQAGSQAYATNGRKNGEGGGAGTGVLAFYDGVAWRACDTGATVAA